MAHFMGFTRSIAYASLLLVAIIWCDSAAQTGTPKINLSINGQQIEAEVAANGEARRIGLMNRHALPDGQGMLFVFPKTGRHCMWMESTFIPLSVAFVDEHFKIINIADMQPQSLTFHCSAGPAVYAIEANEGWFRRNGIGSGDLVGGLHNAPRGE